MTRHPLFLPTVVGVTGLALIVAGVGLWLGVAAALIAAGVPLVALALLWEETGDE